MAPQPDTPKSLSSKFTALCGELTRKINMQQISREDAEEAWNTIDGLYDSYDAEYGWFDRDRVIHTMINGVLTLISTMRYTPAKK